MPRKNNASTIESPITISDAIRSQIEAIHSGDADLRKPQIAILMMMAEARGPLTLRQISEYSINHNGHTVNNVGAEDDAIRARTEKRIGYPTLVTLGYLKVVHIGDKNGTGRTMRCYQITPEGRKAVKRILADEAE